MRTAAVVVVILLALVGSAEACGWYLMEQPPTATRGGLAYYLQVAEFDSVKECDAARDKERAKGQEGSDRIFHEYTKDHPLPKKSVGQTWPQFQAAYERWDRAFKKNAPSLWFNYGEFVMNSTAVCIQPDDARLTRGHER